MARKREKGKQSFFGKLWRNLANLASEMFVGGIIKFNTEPMMQPKSEVSEFLEEA